MILNIVNRRNFLKQSLTIVPALGIATTIQPEQSIDWNRIKDLVRRFDLRYLGKLIGDDHPALAKNISYSFDMIHTKTASQWNMTPSELYDKSIKDREEMYAYIIFQERMASFLNWKASHKRKKFDKNSHSLDKLINTDYFSPYSYKQRQAVIRDTEFELGF